MVDYTPDLDVRGLKNLPRPTIEEEEWVPKPCLSLKKTKDLGKTLIRAKLREMEDPPKSTNPIIIRITPNLDGRSAPCGYPFCKCCRAMSRKIRAISTSNHKSFPVPRYTNCHTSCVVYLLECTKCNKGNQYVGQTERTLQERMGGHRQAATIKINLPLYKHFTGKRDHDFEKDAKVTILEKTTTNLLLTREAHWILTLDTVYPKGLNSRFDTHLMSTSGSAT